MERRDQRSLDGRVWNRGYRHAERSRGGQEINKHFNQSTHSYLTVFIDSLVFSSGFEHFAS